MKHVKLWITCLVVVGIIIGGGMYFVSNNNTTNTSDTTNDDTTSDSSYYYNSYEELITETMDAFNNNAANTLVYEACEYTQTAGNYVSGGTAELLQSNINSYLEYFDNNIGDNYTITYEITSYSVLSDTEVNELINEIEDDDYASYMAGVDAIMLGYVDATATDGSNSITQSLLLTYVKEERVITSDGEKEKVWCFLGLERV